MESAEQGQRGELHILLAHLDLYYHSLRLMGQKLASSADASSRDMPDVLYERSLQLGEDCSSALRNLGEELDSEDRRACEAAMSRVELAVERASRATGHTTFMVNIWRAIDAVDHFLEKVAVKYGYATLADRTASRGTPSLGAGGAPFALSSLAYERARTVRREVPRAIAIPMLRTLPRWRARRLLNPGLLLGVVLVLCFVAVAIAAPMIAPVQGDDPYTMPRSSFRVKPEPPGPGHPLGTTEGSYDVFHGLVWGTHVAFRIGLSVTAARLIIGLTVGLVSGYAGGWLDSIMMRTTDAFLAFPIVPATLLMLVFFGPTGLSRVAAASGIDSIIILSLILFGWMQYARLVRGNVLLERSKQYVEAAVAVGARAPRIIWRHVLPNIPQGLFVLAASDIGAMVVLGAVFTFLGLSGRTGLADWGWMLNIGRNWIIGTPTDAFQYWYTYLPPMAAIVLFSAGWNLIGDGLRDAADPRL
jgi:peptide/nickel transport system permease protein